MYNPLMQQTVTSSTVDASAATDTWSSFLLEAKDIEAELNADLLLSSVNSVTTDLVENVKAIISASLETNGLDYTAGMLVNATADTVSRLGYNMGLTLAGESFESEADRVNVTFRAGEAFDVKAKAKAAWEWLKGILNKAKAWVLKLFDGASSLAKSYAKLKETASKKIQDGKSAENGAKFKLSAAQQKQLTTEGNASNLATTTANLLTLVKNQQGFIDTVFDTNLTAVKARITAFDAFVGTINAESIKDDNLEALRTELAKANLFTEVTADAKACGNSMMLAKEGVTADDLTAYKAATSASVAMREVNSKIDGSFYGLRAHADAKNLKYTDGKEFPVIGLDDVVKLCDAAIPALEAIARAKDSFNKGMDAEKTLDSAVKGISNLGEEANSVSPALIGMATKLGNALRDPVGPFASTFVTTLGAVYNVANECASKYTK